MSCSESPLVLTYAQRDFIQTGLRGILDILVYAVEPGEENPEHLKLVQTVETNLAFKVFYRAVTPVLDQSSVKEDLGQVKHIHVDNVLHSMS
jgi:hypothetical protein